MKILIVACTAFVTCSACLAAEQPAAPPAGGADLKSIARQSLAKLDGELAVQAREQQVLGGDVEIEIEPLDETTSIIPIDRIIRRFRRNANCDLSVWSGCKLTSLHAPLISRGSSNPLESRSPSVAFT